MLTNARRRGSERSSPILQHLLILQTQSLQIQKTIGIMDKTPIYKSGWIYVRPMGKWLLKNGIFSVSETRFLLSVWEKKKKQQNPIKQTGL